APDRQLKSKSGRAGLDEFNFGRRVAQYVRMCSRCRKENLAHKLRLRRERYMKRQDVPRQRVWTAPIRHALGDQLGVRNNQRKILVGHDGGCSRSDLTYFADSASNFDTVPDADRPLEQDDQAAEEIVRDVLQPKAESNPDRADQDVQ